MSRYPMPSSLLAVLNVCIRMDTPEVRFEQLESFVTSFPGEWPMVNRMLKRCKKCSYVHTEGFKFEVKQMEFMWKGTKPQSDLVATVIKHADSIEITNTMLSNSQSREALSSWFINALAERTKEVHLDLSFSTVRQLMAVIPFKCVVAISLSKTTKHLCTVIANHKHIQSLTLGDYEDGLPLPPVSALALPIGNRTFDAEKLVKNIHPSTKSLSLLLHSRDFESLATPLTLLALTEVDLLVVRLCFEEIAPTKRLFNTKLKSVQSYAYQLKLFVIKALIPLTNVGNLFVSLEMDLVHGSAETVDETLEEVYQRANKHNSRDNTDENVNFVEIPLYHTAKHCVKLSALY